MSALETAIEQTTKRRVLVVDDSKFVRTTFATILRGSFDVREEADGEAAWKTIQSDPSITIVFTDLDMPKLNGFGLLARLRSAKDARIRAIPVVVISGVDEPASKERAREAGASDFISKSAEAGEVLGRLENILRRVGPAKQAESAGPASADVASAALASTAPTSPALASTAPTSPPPLTQDPVTGALTGEQLLVDARKHFSYARRHGSELSVMALRIDSYRDLARAAGKDWADQVLARIAKALIGQMRAEDSVARTAPATFMVVAAGTSAAQMQKLGERLRSQLEQARPTYNGEQLKILTSVGFASLSEDRGEAIEDLLRVALQRLDAPPAPAAAPAPAPAATLPADIEVALQVLERIDPARLGGAANDFLKRLAGIAKLIQVKPR